MQQIFWNLISNSVKFTPRGACIQVLLERVDSHVEISVIDSGEGINAGFMPLVFNRFQQEDASTTRSHGGLGLGLSIVKQLVERLLADCDAQVTIAATAEEAIGRLGESSFDVFVSDIGMPIEDGYSLIRRVRLLDSPMASIPRWR